LLLHNFQSRVNSLNSICLKVILFNKKINMFANPTNVGISQRVVATLVACAVAMVSVGFYSNAQAANLVSVSDTLTDSHPSVVSNHTIAFTISSTGSVTSGQTITVTTPSGFASSSPLLFTDFDLKVAGTDQTIVAGASPAANQWGYTTSGTGSGPFVLTFKSGGGTAVAAANNAIEIQIGTNATFGTTGVNRLINHATPGASYEFYITAGTADTGRTRVAIVNHVTVSAIVNTSFTFTVSGMATSTTFNGTTTTGSTSPTIINFGRLTAGVAKRLSQRLNVTTNARSGFTVTVQESGSLQSSNGADIDSFTNGTNVNTPAVWSAPTNNIALENTWGHWGLTSSDDINASEFSGTKFVAASTTARQIFNHTGPADGTTANVGSTTVGYEIQITPLQEAADDYNTTLTYIATPVF
jgi:hypothetical protein